MSKLHELLSLVNRLVESEDESMSEYDNAELDDGLLLEPTGIVDGEFRVKINGGEYGYKPNPATFQGDINALEREFLYKMAYPGKALAWLKGATILASRPGGAKVATAPSSKSKVTHTATVKSSTGTGDYVCKQHDDGAWTCTCPHHMHRGVECKHIKQVQDQLAQGVPPAKIAASATGEAKGKAVDLDKKFGKDIAAKIRKVMDDEVGSPEAIEIRKDPKVQYTWAFLTASGAILLARIWKGEVKALDTAELEDDQKSLKDIPVGDPKFF